MTTKDKRNPEGSAEIQGKLWGLRAKDWANQELKSSPLFESIISNIRINGTGTSLLDIGCGSGMLCKIAFDKGFNVTGFDASYDLLEEAGKRLGKEFFIRGDMENLPFEDASFDVVTGITSFQFAKDTLNALKEANRVLKKDGQFVMGIWGSPQDCEAVSIISVMKELAPPPPPGSPTLPPLSALYEVGKLEQLISDAGFNPVKRENVTFSWNYENEDEIIRSFLSAGGMSLSLQYSGEEKVRDTLLKAMQPFRNGDGSASVKNTFIYVIAEK